MLKDGDGTILPRCLFFFFFFFFKEWTDARHPVLRSWIRSSEVQGECHYENWKTTSAILSLDHIVSTPP